MVPLLRKYSYFFEFLSQLNRCSKLEKGGSLSNSLFENLDPIFVAENTVPPKFELAKLIRKCGGKVTTSFVFMRKKFIRK